MVFKRAIAVTLHDTNKVDPLPDAIYVGGAGNLKITDVDGNTLTLSGLAAGFIYEVSPTVAWSGGSTATNIVALYAR